MASIYPSNYFDNLMSKSQLVVDNVATRQELNYQTNVDGTPVLVEPTSTLKNLIDTDTSTGIVYDLVNELSNLYTQLTTLGGNSDITGEDPSSNSPKVDVFTNLKQIKLRRLQTQVRLICFELKRLTLECNKIASLDEHNLPDAHDEIYPSGKRSYDNPNAGW